MAATAARVGEDLEVVGEGLALGEVGDKDGEEGQRERDAREAQQDGVSVTAQGGDKAVEEFKGDDFEEPEANGDGGGRGLEFVCFKGKGGWRGGTYIAG